MKRADLVAALRKLQAEAYGAEPLSRCYTDRAQIKHDLDKHYQLGVMFALSRNVARGIDSLLSQIEPAPARRRRAA